MEIIGVILMIVVALVSASSRNKKTSANNGGAQRANAHQPLNPEALARAAAQAGRREAPKPAQPTVKPAEPRVESTVTQTKQPEYVAQAAPGEGRSMLEDEACRGGSMPHAHTEGDSTLEDEDCDGGSMAHTHTEGVSRTAHARRMAELDHSRQTDEDDGLIPQTIDAQALRRAVVMAEILGKPRAMRRS